MTLPRCYIPVVWLLLAQAGAAQMPAPVLQAILSLEKMTPLHASVRVSGVVTAVEAGRFFLQDRTAAMSILRTPTTPNIKAGDVCEAVGSIQSKNAGLEMQPVTITITGQAALPAAKTASVAQLQSGGAKYQRVKFTGHVHEVGVTADSIIIALESSGSTCVATWPSEAADAASAKPPLDLLDALVEIEGVAPPQLSNAVRPGGLRIVLAQASHLKVKQLGHADPFQRPHRDLAKMRGKDTEAGVRYLVRGTVSYWSDAGWFYFQDGTSSARGNSGTFLPLIIGWPYRMEARNPPLKAGDQIELVGYREPAVGAMPSFLHCTWRVVGHTDPPPFEPTTLKKILATDREGYPVSVTGKVTDIQFQRDAQGFINHNLWMDAEGLSCRVLVQKKNGHPMPVNIGNHIRVTGTASFNYSTTGAANSLRINVNDFAHIQRIPPPPFWQEPAVLRWLSVIAAIIFLAVLWILVLRRQVKVQTAQIQNNAHQLQRQLEHEKELSEMKSRFVFTVSHEFRNPLAAIMSCSDVLQRTRGQISAEEHDIQISDIQQSVRRMADMMEEVLLLGRAEAGRMPCEPEPVDLHVFMLKLTDQISSASNGRCPIELTVDPQIPQQMMDPSLLQHILGNLISNAVKYSPPGMSVEVSVKPESGTVIFTIHDYGLGIPTLDRPRIFEPFQRGSNVGETAGTGLGLAIAERCARAHGGSISCESAAGEGTTFTVRLPSTAETTSP